MDEIIRAVSKDGFAKISVVTARDAVQRANAIHHCSPTAIAALGRSLCAASMLGDLLKEENGVYAALWQAQAQYYAEERE
jgi:molecular chaperone Hsp33